MLINWKEDRVLTMTNPATKEMLVLLPGVNEISDKALQAGLAKDVEIYCKAGRMEKIQADVRIIPAKRDSSGKEESEKVEIKSKSFAELSAEEASSIISKTVSIKQLEDWKETTSKESVRLEIMKRIEEVEKKGTKVKK